MSARMLRYECDCDVALAMEEMGVGVEEILQHARAVLPRRDIRSLVRGLESILQHPEPPSPPSAEPDNPNHAEEVLILGGKPWNDETT